MKKKFISPQRRGAFWMMGWALSFGLAMMGNKLMRNYFELPMIVWTRCAFALIFIAPFVRPPFVTGSFFLQLIRGGVISAAMTCTYVSYRYLSTHVAAIIGTTSSLFVIIFSIFFLKEHVNWRRWILLFVGYVGVLVIILHEENRGAGSLNFFYKLLGLMGNIAGAVGMLIARSLALRQESKSVTLFYGTALPLLVFTGVLPFFWKTPDHYWEWSMLVFIGACGALSQFCMFSALQVAPASFLAPFEYVRLCLMAPLGWLFFQEQINGYFYVGAVLIIVSTIWLANLSRKSAFS
jgi:drug/metabolite transporter (DMT)-like permease